MTKLGLAAFVAAIFAVGCVHAFIELMLSYRPRFEAWQAKRAYR